MPRIPHRAFKTAIHLYRIRVNQQIGELLLKQRRKALKTSLEAAKSLNIPIKKIRSYELGTEGIALCIYAKLIRFYGLNEYESAWKMNLIPHELDGELPVISLARVAIHRLQTLGEAHFERSVDFIKASSASVDKAQPSPQKP